MAKAVVILPANPISSPFLQSGEFVARFDVTPGITYTVEYSDAIPRQNWQKATNMTAPRINQGSGVGVFEFRDRAISAQRFYRAVYPAY